MLSLSRRALIPSIVLWTVCVQAVNVIESTSRLTFSNDKFSFDVLKSNGYIQNIQYSNISVLGSVAGNAGQLYSDFPSNGFALTSTPTFDVVKGKDWAGIVFTDNNTALSSLVQRSWFLRDTETGLHSFLRLASYNVSTPGVALGESRTMFRPNNAPGASPWTHIVTDEEQWSPLPGAQAQAQQVQVQDATWWLGNTPDDPYYQQESEYWTKYTFASNQSNKAHGLYGTTSDGRNVGAWWVVNQKDTFFGGPLHIDLMVDGIAYNKQSTGHGGATSPIIKDGFDRTFGPQFLHFNTGLNVSLFSLLADAQSLSNASWNAAFYDEIAPYVPGYAASGTRGAVSATVRLPSGASDATFVLSANGYHFQDSALDPSAYQYWGALDTQGGVALDRVKAGTYRATVYAKGIFGDFVQDNVVVSAGETTHLNLKWTAESAGRELWRIGIPDKTSGEFANGFERDLSHPRQPAKYRIYWGAWDFPAQFPGGVNYTVGSSDFSRDFNYVHWSRYGGTHTRNDTVTDINRWTINFSLDSVPPPTRNATFTIQLAGAKTTAGNTDSNQGDFPSFPIDVYVNNQSTPLSWTIDAVDSSSCGERSAISCHLLTNKFVFPATWFQKGWNKIVLALPFNAPVYVQYDALRLEVSK